MFHGQRLAEVMVTDNIFPVSVHGIDLNFGPHSRGPKVVLMFPRKIGGML